MANAPIDQNSRQGLIAVSDVDGTTIVPLYADPTTHRLLVDLAGGSGTVTSVSVVTANGFAGTVATATTTPAITLTTTITGVLKGNGTAISAASAGTDYVAPGAITTSGLTMATARLLGRTTAATGAVEEITVGTGLSFAAGTLSATGVASSIVVGTTTITSGTNTRILYDNAGTLGEYTISGTGSVAMTTSPVFTTPNIGVATATSVNGLTITASTGTLTITNGKTLSISNSLTFAGTDGQTFTFPNGTDTVVTLTATQELDNKTLDSSVLKGTFTASGTVTIPAITAGGAITLAENSSIAQDPALSADGKYTGDTVTGTAGAALAFGDLIYLDPTDSRWELADANAASGADGDSRGILGICVQAAASDGDPTTVLLWGFVRADTAFPTFTINNPVYVSETAGDVTGTQPTTTDVVIRIVGAGFTADTLFFNPDQTWITHT